MSDASSKTLPTLVDASPLGDDSAKRLGNPIGVVALTAVIFIISQVVAYALVSAAHQLFGIHGKTADWLTDSSAAQFAYIFLAEGIVITAVIVYVRRRRVSLAAIGIKRPKMNALKYGFIGFGAYYVLIIAVSAVLYHFLPGLNTDQQQDIGFNGVAGGGLLLAFLSLCVLAPLGEEILMRGFLYSALRSRMRFISAALITSVLFGLAHLTGGEGGSVIWMAAIATFVLSLALVYAREKTGMIWAGVLIHALNNVVAFGVHFHSGLF